MIDQQSATWTAEVGHARFRALGTSAELVVLDGSRLAAAEALLRAELDAIDAACSRFRPDSEISRLHEQAGRPVRVSALLGEALGVSVRAARLTDGLVDPTVGAAVRALGYDVDFDDLPRDDARPAPAASAAPGWWRLALDEHEGFALLPHGVRLDLGATAKALAADRAAARIHAEFGIGVLVNLGGDLAVAGAAPDGGWSVRVCDDHAAPAEADAPTVRITSGAVATSSTTVRAWRRGGRAVHHLVDPRTGDIAAPVWRTVTVAAASCVDANTASTASIVLGADAPAWLAERRLPARLVAVDGAVVAVGGWPADDAGAEIR